MSDRRTDPRAASTEDDAAPSLEGLTDDILPALVARLRTSRLGELEVRADGWRVRLRRAAAGGASSTGAAARTNADPGDDADVADLEHSVVRSPAVGYVSLGTDFVVGRSVQAGDSLGSVDVLGIRQDVAAPSDGVISRVLVEDDQAVEYGQVLAHIDPLGMDLVAGEDADADATPEPDAFLDRPVTAAPR